MWAIGVTIGIIVGLGFMFLIGWVAGGDD